MKWRVLVLGASGFIGHACAREMEDAGHEVLSIGRKRDVPGLQRYRASALDAASLQAAASDFRPDLCINAAGSGSPAASVGAPAPDFEANVALVQRILETLRITAPGCRYVGFSSAAIYGDNPQLPWREDARPCPRSPYGYHKLCAELLVEEYHRLYGLGTLTLRAFSVYGPGLRKQLLWDLFQRSRRAEELQLFGTGRETRDFIYIDDVAASVRRIAEQGHFMGKALNLGSGRVTTIAELCGDLLRELGWQGSQRFTGDEIPGSPLRMEADMSRSFGLGLHPGIELSEGLRRTAAWLQSHGHQT